MLIYGCNYTTHVSTTDASNDQAPEGDGSDGDASTCCPVDEWPVGGCYFCIQNPGGSRRNGQCAQVCGGGSPVRLSGYRTDTNGCRVATTELTSMCLDAGIHEPLLGTPCDGPFDFSSCQVGYECAQEGFPTDRCLPLNFGPLGDEAFAAGSGAVNFTDQGISFQGFSTFDESGECPVEGLSGIINLMAINGNDFNHPAYEDLYCQQQPAALRARSYTELGGPAVIVRFVPAAGDQSQFQRLTLGSAVACNTPGTVTAEIHTFGPNGTDLGWVPITQGYFEYRRTSASEDGPIQAYLVGLGQVGENTVTIRVKFRGHRALYFC